MSKKNNPTKEKYIQQISERGNLLDSVRDKLLFNFKYFQYGEESGESFEEWEREEILADLNNKLKEFSEKTRQELQIDGTLEIYGDCPKGSEFKKPKALDISEIEWSRLRITGIRRLAGFFLKCLKNEVSFLRHW